MANIIQLEDSSGSVFYPQTHEKAVIDSNGVSLDEKLQDIPTAAMLEDDDLSLDNEKLKFANRAYNSSIPNGLGYVILRDTATFASQVTATYTVYEIRYKFDLSNSTVTVPTGCVLNFVGGEITNGTLTLNGTLLTGKINITCAMSGTMKNRTLYSSWNDNVVLSVSNAKALGSGICVDKAATLTAPLSFFGLKEVEIRSTITNTSTNYVEIGYSDSLGIPSKFEIWNCTYVKMTGGKESIVTIRDAENFVLEVDSAVSTKGSIAYCTFHLGRIRHFSIIGHNNGWINENTFIKGRFMGSFTIQGDGYPHNHNVFYNPTFEGDLTISLDRCNYNVFRDCRFEGDVPMTFGDNANNNRFYRSWFTSYHSLWRMYYGIRSKRCNGIFFDDSVFVKSFTIDKNSYINGRDLAKVSLCDDNDSVRHEVSSIYARLKIWAPSDFGVIMVSDNSAMSRMRVTFYDNSGTNISDTLTSYISSLGNFTKVSTDPNNIYYKLDRDDNYAYLEVMVDNINAYLKNQYGVDGNDQPNKQLGYVIVHFAPDNVRRVFNYVDLRVVFPAKARDNAGVLLKLPFSAPQNISSSKPTVKSTISGTSVPYSILDGESCLVTGKNVLYRRVGSDILLVGGVGAQGSTRPTLAAGDVGYQFFDTTLGKCIVWNGTAWVNVDGSALS